MSKKVAFFYPGSNIGGAQVLFSRLGEYLSQKDIEIINIDFGNSFISNYFNDLNIPFEHVIIDENILSKNIISDDYIFIVPASFLFILNRFFCFTDKSKFIFWELHPDNIIDHTVFSYFYKNEYSSKIQFLFKLTERSRLKKIKNFLSIAHDKNGLYFMCYRNFVTNLDFFNLTFNPNYLPIPQPYIKKNSSLSVKFKDEIHIGWLSRLEKAKVDVLNLLISDLEVYSKAQSKYRIVLHVIGIGSSSDNILKSDYIDIVSAGKLFSEKLTQYTNINLDIAFAMGTSALDFASRSLPTVLVPSSVFCYKYTDCRYFWLHKVKGYDLATEQHHKYEALNIGDILSDIEKNGIEFYGDASYEYVFDNHSMSEVGDNLLKILSLVELRYEDIEESGIYNPNNIELLFLALKNLVKKILVG